MKPILVIYATREGHTRRIAEHLGAALGTRQHPFDLVDAAHILEGFSVTKYSAAIVCASLHLGKYESEMTKFVKRHLAELQQIATVFVSVSLTERAAEDATASPEKRAEAQTHVKTTIDRFLAETGWHPSHIAAVAGALMYSKYNFITRFIMKRVSKKEGGPVDTTRDYEFTDWPRLERLVENLVQGVSIPLHVHEAAIDKQLDSGDKAAVV